MTAVLNRRGRTVAAAVVFLQSLTLTVSGEAILGDDPAGSDAALVEVAIISSADGTAQPAMWGAPGSEEEPVPLLVHLHTWSGDFRQADPRDTFFALAQEHGWAFIHPNFRGPNQTPEALGSRLAIADVIDAVHYAKDHANIDASRIYLAGSSGGGHMALQMAAHHPDVWAGVSAWVPIGDLFAWHATHTKIENNQRQPGRYAAMIEAACGGPPGTPTTDREYVARSPLFHLHRAAGLPIDLNVGIHDGHQGSVPVDQSLEAFNVLAEANGHPAAAFTPEEIVRIRDDRQIPEADRDHAIHDLETPREYVALFRRYAGPVRITVFDGGHRQDEGPAVIWLNQQRKKPTP